MSVLSFEHNFFNEQLSNIVKDIEDIVYQYDITYIEACIMYCESKDLEFENIGEMIKQIPHLLSKIQTEAEHLNYIKSSPDKLMFA